LIYNDDGAYFRYDESLRQLAQDAYYCAVEHGPEHVTTAAAYYYMADVNMLYGKADAALGNDCAIPPLFC